MHLLIKIVKANLAALAKPQNQPFLLYTLTWI